MPNFDQDTYQQLLDNGAISPDTFSQIQGLNAPVAPQPNIPLVAPAPVAQTTPNVSPTIADAETPKEITQLPNTNLSQANKVEDAYNSMQQAQAAGAVAGIGKASEDANYYTKVQKDLKDRAEAEAKRQQEEQDQLAKAHANRDAVEQQVMKTKIDPNRFFNNMSTGNKITAGIALVLGGMGAGLQRSNVNQAAQTIDAAIDRDMKAQFADLDTQKGILGEKRGIISDYMRQFGDRRQAEAAAKASYLGAAQMKLNEISSKYQSPQILANAQNMNAQLELQKQQALSVFTRQAQLQNMAGNNDTARAIPFLPPEMQKSATDELGQANKIKDALKRGDALIEKLHNESRFSRALEAKVPGTEIAFKNESPASAELTALFKSLGVDAKGEAKIEAMIKPLKGGAVFKGDLEEKKAVLRNIIKNTAPAMGTLDRFGINPIPKELNTEKPGQK